MDFKSSSKAHCSKSIPYMRSREESSDDCKKNHVSNFIFQYRIGFISVLFSSLLVGCFIMIVIYYNMQSDRYSESIEVERQFPHESWLSFDVDSDTKAAVIQMASDKDVYIPNIPFLQDELQAKTRRKRQARYARDCTSGQKECQAVLTALQEMTQSMSNRLEELKNQLIAQNILSANDPQEINYQKILDCLECQKTIDQKAEEKTEYLARQKTEQRAHINDVLPYFDNEHFAAESKEHEIDDNEAQPHKSDDRTERGLTKQVMESVTNSSKVSGGNKITEILHNTTIVEKESNEDSRGQAFHHQPADRPNTGTRGGESHVTRNMGGATPMIIPTAETTMIYQQDPFSRPGGDKQFGHDGNTNSNIPSSLHPFILPTAETTKYSQQIQITPQANPSSLIPICFYNNPPSSGTPQQQQQQPFFTPQSLPQAINPAQANQQIKYFGSNGQPMMTPNFQSSLPGQFLHSAQSAPLYPQQQQFPMINQGPQRNAPYYCTYVQAPNVAQQQQAFPAMSSANGFSNPFLARALANQDKLKNEKDAMEKQLPAAKSTYDDSDEKYFFDSCDGYTCPYPYRKCIAHHQRCDGRVDCMGAEDEIDCPVIEDPYYTRFTVNRQPEESAVIVNDQPSIVEDMTKTITTYIATTVNPPTVIQTTDSNDVETTPFSIMVPEMPRHFICKRIVQTVSMAKRCDGVFDCEDASDEENCICRDYLVLQRPLAVCDGHVDCSDGSDEEGCNFCREDEYHCHRSGGCIPKQKYCNQAYDCKLNEDELDCFILTDGKRVNLDLDKRPHLNLAGVLTRYENGAWRASCFKSEYRSEAKRTTAAQRVCEYLGFRSLDSVNEVIVQKSKLDERHSSKNLPISYEYPPHFSPMPRGDNNTCYGLYIRCKPILDGKVNVHLKKDPETDQRTYLWPWEGSVFADGKYQCPAVLLENDVLMASSKCSEHIDLSKNYTTAVFGVSSPDLPYSGPYQQTSQIIDIRPVKNSDASLFRLKDAVNMTRYVQPIYLEKRIFPASKNDSCVALGVTDHGLRKMKFLQPVVDDCPKCHRCYVDQIQASCSKFNETTNWSGNIVCLSGNGGWYPSAVFQDKDENCGFGKKQVLNSIDFIHAHISEAIDEQTPRNAIEPTCQGVRCSSGQCVPWNHVCNGIRDCRDGADEDPQTCFDYNKRCEENISECKCSQSELRCGNGKCVPKEKFCDGKVDCADGSDEPASCTCAEYLKLTKPKLVCDNRRHCLDKSDEDYRYCHCKDNSFKCHKSSYNGTVACVSPDVVCDGHPDCPEGEDESDNACITIKPGRFDPHGKGELLRRSYGVWQSICLPEPTKQQSEVLAACRKIGYTAGLLVDGSKIAESIYVPRNDFYMFQPNNHTWMTMREDVSFGVWAKPNMPCYKLFVHCL